MAKKLEVRNKMRQVAQALAFTHQKGIVHRDVKPENILLQDNGHIALCDFGISKDTVHSLYESTVDLTAAGTLGYSAPEAGMVLGIHATSLQVELMLYSFFCMSTAVQLLLHCV